MQVAQDFTNTFYSLPPGALDALMHCAIKLFHYRNGTRSSQLAIFLFVFIILWYGLNHWLCVTDILRVPANKQSQPDFVVPALSLMPEGPTAHDEVSRLCLIYLKCKLVNYLPAVLARTSDHPFVRYAVTGCLDHIRTSGTDSKFRDFLLQSRQHSITPILQSGLTFPWCCAKFSTTELEAKDYRGLNTLHVAVGIPSSLAAIGCLLDRVDINSLSE